MDFHDQKDFFKTFHYFYKPEEQCKEPHQMPNWVDGQIYAIDFLLHFLAKHGYTLQKSRSKMSFRDIEDTIEKFKNLQNELFKKELENRHD